MKSALRSLRNSPGFTLATVLTLALGIGVTTAIFSVLYAVLLKPFAYPDADRLVAMWQKGPQMEMSISWPTAQDWLKEQQSFTALAIRRGDQFNISGAGQLPENIRGGYVSASLFDVAALRPVAGRYFNADEDKVGGAPVVVISESLWTRRFNRDPALIGREIPVDGVQRTVVGVAPTGLDIPRRAEIWLPLFPYAATQQNWQSRGNNPGLHAIGRLKPGVTLEQVRADMERIYTGLRAAYPDNRTGVSALVMPFRQLEVGDFRAGLWALLAATGFVLAIACANVASLFITRGTRQQRDFAVRSALGASRGTLIRQMLGESVLIALVGGALGVLLAWWSLDVIRHFVPAGSPRFQNIGLNGWVLAFSVFVAVASGILAGLWPALRLSRVDVRSALHEGSRGSTTGSGIRRILVGGQVALTLVLLSTSGLILRSFAHMQSAALGFDAASTLTFSVSLPESRYGYETDAGGQRVESEKPARRFYFSLLERIAQLPGVAHVAAGTTPPLNAGWQSSFSIEGVHGTKDRNRPLAEMGIVSDDYFATLKVPLLQGRMFNAHDATGPKVAIVDEAFVKKWWPGQNPLGRRAYWGFSANEAENWFTIIGVVPTLRVYGYDEAIVRPQAYWSMHQFTWTQEMILVRTAGINPRQLERQIRELLAQLDGEVALFDVDTMQAQVEATYANPAMQSFLLTVFSVLALVLALTGLYSVVAYGVSMRQREIGVRMALGAQSGDVVRLMFRQGMIPLLAGLGAGLIGAFAAAQAIRSQLYEVSPTDPFILIAAPLVLALAAATASYLPARRATRIDPANALRAE